MSFNIIIVESGVTRSKPKGLNHFAALVIARYKPTAVLAHGDPEWERELGRVCKACNVAFDTIEGGGDFDQTLAVVEEGVSYADVVITLRASKNTVAGYAEDLADCADTPWYNLNGIFNRPAHQWPLWFALEDSMAALSKSIEKACN